MVRILAILVGLYVLWRMVSKALGLGPAPKTRAVPPRGDRSGTGDRGKSPWEVLGVPPGAAPEEIKAAYQRLVRQYHPDKVAELGAELQALAEEKTKELNRAYEQLRTK